MSILIRPPKKVKKAEEKKQDCKGAFATLAGLLEC